MDSSISLDILFLILTLLILPSTSLLSSSPSKLIQNSRTDQPLSTRPSTSNFDGSTPNSPNPSSPYLSMIPSITLTPDPQSSFPQEPILERQHEPSPPVKGSRHKRKSVSFSLSSMTDLYHPPPMGKKRPPTPFIPHGSIPGLVEHGHLVPSLPPTPSSSSVSSLGVGMGGGVRHNLQLVDSMGVQKSWLMP